MNLNDGIHYNWAKTLSYNSPKNDVTMVVGAPNKGKTYGIRGYALCHRYLKHGRRFVEVCRETTTRDAIKQDYLDKLFAHEPELEGFEWKCQTNDFYIRRPLQDGKMGKWECCGYIVSMPEMQRVKQRTFVDVESIIMDEAIIEHMDRWHRYLPNEWNILTRIVDSCAREQPDEQGRIKPHVYLLGNAVDALNPYFSIFGIKKPPSYGYHWYHKKQYLLHMAPADEHDERRKLETTAGRMGAVTGYTEQTYANRFKEDTRYICKKPQRAKFMMGVVAYGKRYGIWCDFNEGFYYVTSKIPANAEYVYTLTREDDSPNLMAARRTTKALKDVTEFYYMGAVLFESVPVREGFLDALKMFGMR